MTLTTRRIIAIIFFVLFMVSAPMLILYTAGFRYNFKKTQLTKTGALVIDSEPSGAFVYLNEQKIKSKTPVRLNNILPDEYSIKIEKSGYFPWNKKLNILTQETTFAEDIVLFKKSVPETIKEQTDKSAWLNFSPDKKSALYVEKDALRNSESLFLLNLNNRKLTSLFNTKNLNDSNIFWSKNGSYFVLTDNNQSQVVTMNEPTQKFALIDKTGQTKSNNFHWSHESNDLLYFQRGNDIFELNLSFNIENKTFSLPKNEELLDYFIFEKKIYLIERIGGKNFLTKQSLNSDDKQILSKAIELKNDQFNFDHPYRNLLSIKDSLSNTLYLIDTDLNKIYYQKDGVINTALHKNGYLLLISTNQELSILNLTESDPKEKIITRYSQGLQKAAWHNSSNYVFALQNEQIDVIELDDRSGHQTINLAAGYNLDFSTDAKAQTLFYLQKKDQLGTKLQYQELD